MPKVTPGWQALLAGQPPESAFGEMGCQQVQGSLRAPLEFALSGDLDHDIRRAWVQHLVRHESTPDPESTYPAILAALRLGDRHLVKTLLDHGLDVRRSTPLKVTALHMAAGFAPASLCQLLLDKGLDFHAQDDSGRTPLHWAVRHENKRAYAVFYHAGADWTRADARGETPLSELRARKPHQAVYWSLRPTRDAIVDSLGDMPPQSPSRPKPRL